MRTSHLQLRLFDTMSRTARVFLPENADEVKMYVCGPTVYDRVHIGNLRSAVIYDLLFRVLRALYRNVTYVRNITDIDDKIIVAAQERGVSLTSLTTQMTDYYHADLHSLFCLSPTFEPKVTQHLDDIHAFIKLLLERGYAYQAAGDVLFAIDKYQYYGELSNRKIEEAQSGHRTTVREYKVNPEDFVLWKGQVDSAAGYQSPWGYGRPGWHIECAAMATKYLGTTFDIHGGGIDLLFPHHENELAQSKCAHPGSSFSNYWIHNGFLTVNGEKMSKSKGNVLMSTQLKERGIAPVIMRYFFLVTHYRKPLDFTDLAIAAARSSIMYIARALHKFSWLDVETQQVIGDKASKFPRSLEILCDDLNTSELYSYMHDLAHRSHRGDADAAEELAYSCELMGFPMSALSHLLSVGEEIDLEVVKLAEERKQAQSAKQWERADELRGIISSLGYRVEDAREGYRLIKNHD